MKPRWRLVAFALFGVACSVDTAPNTVTSLEFSALPFPAVVAQDTLRDTSGIAAPLRAVAFNLDNGEILDAPVRYATLEGVISVDSVTGVVVGGAQADTTARVVAFIGGLQSAPLRLSVVPRPDAVIASGTIDTLRYSVTDTTVNVSGDLSVRVVNQATTPNRSVRDWIVTFTLGTRADSTKARIENEAQRRSTMDTTSSGGIAARRIRLFPAGLTSPADSIVVLAGARHRGTHIAGSPLRLVLHVRPRVQ